MKRGSLGGNQRLERPSFAEALRKASRRARRLSNQRTWRRRGLTSVQSAIAETHASPPEELSWLGRGLRGLVGLALLPLCAITTVTLFDPALPDAEGVSFWGRFWREESFLYFVVGLVLSAGWFFTGLVQPLFLFFYVLGHELTHAAFVYLCLGRVTGFRVGLDGGHVVTNKSNFLIALSPYFIPFWSVVTLGVMAVLGRLVPFPCRQQLLFALLGATWGFHLLWTLWIIQRDQPDLRENGTFFSLTIIYLANALLLSGLICFASPDLDVRQFFYNWSNNCMDLAAYLFRTLASLHRQAAG